ncbi:hypothetical protein KW805_05010 [Candidatus Pacearchaeota archaeon]|nr:hypothetical protein [Candidatus Pacearchaeota archaeon]
MKKIFKSIGAILLGAATGALLSIGTDFLLESTGIFPPISQGVLAPWMLLVALTYRGVYTIASGYVTAALAPNKPMRHAFILGIIGVVVTILGTLANWDKSAAWYPILLIVITLPCTWLGGKLRVK